jgi:tetratricopeptide (TPR) repeat protein
MDEDMGAAFGPAEILARLGAAQQKLMRGDAAGAAAALEDVLKAAPRDLGALNLLAGIKRQQGDLAAALALLDAAARIAPNAAPIQFNRANLLLEAGRAEEAVEAYGAALKLRPDHPETLLNLARALAHAGRGEEASAAYVRAAAAGLDHPAIWSERAALAASQGDAPAAIAHWRESLKRDPSNADAWFDLARTLQDADQPEDAIAAYDQALARAPANAGAWDNRGAALHALDRLDDALVSYDRALALEPHRAEAHANRGLTLFALKRAGEAIAAFEHAMVLSQGRGLAPERAATLRYNHAMAFLARHKLHEGWAGFAARWDAGMIATARSDHGEPPWRGEEVSTLRVWREQGVGDEILFARLLPLARARVGRLIFECDSRLAPLLTRSFPGIAAQAEQAPTAPADAQCPLGDLGPILGVSADDLSSGAAFLRPDPSRRAQIRARYEALAQGRPIIGIAWSSKSPRRGEAKSAALEHWAALLGRDALFVSLQYGDVAAEIAAANAAFGCAIHVDAEIDQMIDLDGFAAQIAALDRIVSVSNTTIHMAGALGVDTILMPPPARGRLWYWGLEGEATPWYSSVRILRRDLGEPRAAQIARAAERAFP